MSTYTHAGTSRLNGTVKVRFANDAARVKVLAKNGHTDIDLIELKQPMTKEEIVSYLREIDFARGNAEIQAAIDAADEKRNPKEKEPKAKKERAPKKEKAAKPTLESIRAKADAPAPNKAYDDAVMAIRIQVNEMIERGELDESEFDNKVDALVAEMNARDEAALLAEMQADVEAANGREATPLLEPSDAVVTPAVETVADAVDEEAPY